MRRDAPSLREPCPPLAPLPPECEKELARLCRCLWRQCLIWDWDQGELGGLQVLRNASTPPYLALGLLPHPLLWPFTGFCRALGSARDDRALSSSAHTANLWKLLFAPLSDAIREDRTDPALSGLPGEAWGQRNPAFEGALYSFLAIPPHLSDLGLLCPMQAPAPWPWAYAPCNPHRFGSGAELGSTWPRGRLVLCCF